MAKGFHSRSPNEFKDYLDGLKKDQKKVFWKQLIIFVDIILIMLIFYVVYQFINPGSINLGQKSVVENYQGMRMSLSASQIDQSDGALLYLVVDNKSALVHSIPSPDWKVFFQWNTESGILCDQNEYIPMQSPKKIPPYSSTMLELPIPPPTNPNSLTECSIEEFQKRKLFGIGGFKKKVFHLKITIQDKNMEMAEFQVPINPFKR
jgi:hypothetical protein